MGLWDLQIIALCLCVHFTQCTNLFGGGCSIHHDHLENQVK